MFKPIYNSLHINIYRSETSLFVISDGKGLGASQDNTSTPAVMANAALRPSRCTYHALKLKTGMPPIETVTMKQLGGCIRYV